jgi:hypothetical protein
VNPGPKPDMVREAWELRFNLKPCARKDHRLTEAMMAQLSFCKTDECWRLILGISS